MAYGAVIPYRRGNKLVIEVELPDEGEPSQSGNSDNLVDPKTWRELDSLDDSLMIKLTVCRPYRRRLSNRERIRRLG
jgi:hypothetical protein